MAASSERDVERRYVRLALAFVVLVAAALVAADLVRLALAESPARIDQVRRCFEEELGVPVFSASPGSLADSAELGAVRTTIELNPVTYAIAGSEEAAADLAARAREASSFAEVEVRGDIVLLWEGPTSATQRQAIYDCSH